MQKPENQRFPCQSQRPKQLFSAEELLVQEYSCGLNSRAKSVHLECGRSGRVQGERALLSSESFANNKGRSSGKEGRGEWEAGTE